jgi:acyl transferase domain-containing protein
MNERRDMLRESLAAIERLQARLQASENAIRAPIAIVGAGCRYPGGVQDPEGLWQLVCNGVDAVTEVPAERWNADAYYDPNPKASGKMVTRRGGFITNVDRFEPQFFGISPREAASMDPQHRLLLETSYEALEQAAIAPETLVRSLTGVFIGITTGDYGQLMRIGGPESTDVYSATGTALNAAAGRISFALGLHGPCIALDTACSSSLVAIHLACQSLRAGECSMALAGGVNVILSPDAMVLFSKWGMMAPDGACKTFDAAADGFVRAEGCAVVALKLLSSAIEAGDPILAVIRGSAVNSDGRSSGLTVPNGLAQQAVIRSALANAQLQPVDIDYVEAHGTGTPLGDPIEVEALGCVYGEGRQPERPLCIGSIKTNIGHSEAASGIAGLLKVIMQLKHGAIAPHLHFKTANPGIRWENYAVSVPTKLTSWPTGPTIRRAGVSSFGFSGTNAHLIVEEAPVAPRKPEPYRNSCIITLSARSRSALQQTAKRLGPICSPDNPSTLQDISTTLALGRTHHKERAAFVCDSKEALRAALTAIEHGNQQSAGPMAEGGQSERRKIGFLFTGQGSQYSGMGRALYESEALVRGILDRATDVLSGVLKVPLLDVMFNESKAELLAETQYTQPALFALEYALAELWRSWGVEPTIVAGHSVGEYAAACVAGVFSFEDGLSLVGRRGKLMQELDAGGGMAAVFCARSQVQKYVDERSDHLSVAALNGPEETVLSGTIVELERVLALLAADGVQSRRLQVSHAFHSPLLTPMLGSLDACAGEINHTAPVISLASNVSGALFQANRGPVPTYWSRHARQPVDFLGCIEAMKTENVTTLIEIGPQPTLLTLVERARTNATWKAVSSLRRGRDDRDQLLGSLANIYANGTNIDWRSVGAVASGRRIALPTYPFERSRHWRNSPNAAISPVRDIGHPLLGERRDVATRPGEYTWQRQIGSDTHSHLFDHCVGHIAILPSVVLIEMAVAAGREVFSQGSLSVRHFRSRKPMMFRGGEQRIVQVALVALVGGADDFEFNVHSRSFGLEVGHDAPWVWHASGQISRMASHEDVVLSKSLDAFRSQSGDPLSPEQFYKLLAERSNLSGPSLRGVTKVWLTEDEAVACVDVASVPLEGARDYLNQSVLSGPYVHPVLALLSKYSRLEAVRCGIKEVRSHQTSQSLPTWTHARVRQDENDSQLHVCDVSVYDNEGRLLSETIGADPGVFDDQNSASSSVAPADWFYRSIWCAKPKIIEGPRGSEDGLWLIFDDGAGLGAAIAKLRGASGERTVLVTAGDEWSVVDSAITINPSLDSDYRRLVKLTNPSAILYLWSAENSRNYLSGNLMRHSEQVLRLVQSVRMEIRPTRPRLWFVTSGTQKVVSTDRCDRPDNAMLWGMLRALSAEHAELWGGLIDQEDKFPISADELIREVKNGDAEDKVAFRQGLRYVARLERYDPYLKEGGSFIPRSDVTYLVTGGLGGIGLAFARWLVEQGARHLLLLGRSRLPDPEMGSPLDPDSTVGRKVAVLEAMRLLGANVETASVNVASAEEIDRCLAERTLAGFPDVGGVIHAAGILQFEALETQTAKSLHHGLDAKVLGAWHLHRKYLDQKLDCFVMCSSSSALLNSPLLGGYAAGNAFLDALAEHRKARGMSALSVNWGTWGEVGMASGSQAKGDLLTGFGTISTAQGLSALSELLRAGLAHLAVMPIDWPAFASKYPAAAMDPFLSDMIAGVELKNKESITLDMTGLVSARPEEQVKLVENYLHAQVALILGMSPEELSPTVALASMGLDSLMAVQLKGRLETELSITVPIGRILGGASSTDLASFVLDHIRMLPTDKVREGMQEEQWEEGTL